jgi:hypothetical protein
MLHGYVQSNRNLQLYTILFADDIALKASSEDGLQNFVHNLQTVANRYKMEINTEKKHNSFSGKDLMPSKIF